MAFEGELLLGLTIFLVSVGLIVSRVVDEVSAALLGVVAMIILLKGYTVEEAFGYIDWDIIAILLGMWIITGYMIKAGLAEWTVGKLLHVTRDYRIIIVLLAIASGFLSILVDNVIVILIFGSVAAKLAKDAGGSIAKAIILVGLSANFMGTALLMGDLPPQLLHSVAGMEFLDFIVWRGAPSSFPLLTLTFLAVIYLYYKTVMSSEPSEEVEEEYGENVDRLLLAVSSAFFTATIIGMALRPRLGVPLGFITVTGAALLSITVEALRLRVKRLPSFKEIIEDVEWRALLFYASLFSLVGGLEASGALEAAAKGMLNALKGGVFEGYTTSFWTVALLSTFVEHDALLITFLYLMKEVAHSLPYHVEILYWGMAWSATLASNLTTAAAPALYVAVTLVEKETGEKLRGSQFIRLSAPFVVFSLVIHYLLTAILWLPLVS
ncbi:MAG: permease [Desulfurococcales archaeon]|nr:permease [Desulfurococcales archaeon]